jgi:PEP-CTERM motif
MKQHAIWYVAALAVAGGLASAGSLRGQTWTLSDFQSFSLSATYANWDVDGSQIINGGTGYTPSLTAVPTGFEVVAQGYGSGAYDFATPVDATGATMFQLTFTLNTPMQHGDGSGLWFGPNLTISDGTHQVALLADNAGGGFRSYGPYVGPGTYALYGSLGDLDASTITAFNIEVDPAEYGAGAPYDITYNNLSVYAVPEPATAALLLLGAAGWLIARRRD